MATKERLNNILGMYSPTTTAVEGLKKNLLAQVMNRLDAYQPALSNEHAGAAMCFGLAPPMAIPAQPTGMFFLDHPFPSETPRLRRDNVDMYSRWAIFNAWLLYHKRSSIAESRNLAVTQSQSVSAPAQAGPSTTTAGPTHGVTLGIDTTPNQQSEDDVVITSVV